MATVKSKCREQVNLDVKNRLRMLLELAVRIGMREGLLGQEPARTSLLKGSGHAGSGDK
jgi:hypothetical protein